MVVVPTAITRPPAALARATASAASAGTSNAFGVDVVVFDLLDLHGTEGPWSHVQHEVGPRHAALRKARAERGGEVQARRRGGNASRPPARRRSDSVRGPQGGPDDGCTEAAERAHAYPMRPGRPPPIRAAPGASGAEALPRRRLPGPPRSVSARLPAGDSLAATGRPTSRPPGHGRAGPPRLHLPPGGRAAAPGRRGCGWPPGGRRARGGPAGRGRSGVHGPRTRGRGRGAARRRAPRAAPARSAPAEGRSRRAGRPPWRHRPRAELKTASSARAFLREACGRSARRRGGWPCARAACGRGSRAAAGTARTCPRSRPAPR